MIRRRLAWTSSPSATTTMTKKSTTPRVPSPKTVPPLARCPSNPQKRKLGLKSWTTPQQHQSPNSKSRRWLLLTTHSFRMMSQVNIHKKALLHSVVGTISSFTLTAFRLISSGRPRTHTLQRPRWLHRRACQAYETDRAGKGPDQVSGRIEPRPRTRLQGFAQRHC